MMEGGTTENATRSNILIIIYYSCPLIMRYPPIQLCSGGILSRATYQNFSDPGVCLNLSVKSCFNDIGHFMKDFIYTSGSEKFWLKDAQNANSNGE